MASQMADAMFGAARRFDSAVVLLRAFRLLILSGNAAASKQSLPQEETSGKPASLRVNNDNSPVQAIRIDDEGRARSVDPSELTKEEESVMSSFKDVIEV